MPRITVARLRRAGRRETYAVDIGAALNLVGALVKWFSPAFLFPIVIAIGYGEPTMPFVVAGVSTAIAGWTLEHVTRGKERVGAREGFLVVALIWLLIAAFAAVPYVLADEAQFDRPVDAYFEAMSGISTTGASILTDIPALDHSLAMWRQFTQWLGGMGIIVLALAVLPRLRVGGRQLFESETPGPEIEAMTTTIRDAAQRFLLLYVAITAVQAAVLTVIGLTGLDDRMGPYEALAHAFTTLPTGGFSPRARGIEEFGAATQWTIVIFMVIAGTNFALLFRAFVRGRFGAFGRDQEFGLYLALLAAASVLVVFELWTDDIATGEAAVRHALFQVVSMGTTTGYASADFALWTPLTWMILVGLMLIGASAGSTSGSIKVVRHLIIGKMLRRELEQTVHPELVSPLRLNGRIVDERPVRAVIVFVILYLGIAAAGALVILLEAALATELPVGAFDAIAASATTLGNVGPGLGFAGPMGSFEPFNDLSTVTMITLMWIGRLELIPVVVLLTKAYWRA